MSERRRAAWPERMGRERAIGADGPMTVCCATSSRRSPGNGGGSAIGGFGCCCGAFLDRPIDGERPYSWLDARVTGPRDVRNGVHASGMIQCRSATPNIHERKAGRSEFGDQTA
jgi:hypothetical protein